MFPGFDPQKHEFDQKLRNWFCTGRWMTNEDADIDEEAFQRSLGLASSTSLIVVSALFGVKIWYGQLALSHFVFWL